MPNTYISQLRKAINDFDIYLIRSILDNKLEDINDPKHDAEGYIPIIFIPVLSSTMNIEHIITLLIHRGINVNKFIVLGQPSNNTSKHNIYSFVRCAFENYAKLSLDFFNLLLSKEPKFSAECEYNEIVADLQLKILDPTSKSKDKIQQLLQLLSDQKKLLLLSKPLKEQVANYIITNKINYHHNHAPKLTP